MASHNRLREHLRSEMNNVITPVFIICNAYESGFGHGLADDKLCNPYTDGSQEHEAYGIGYAAGLERKPQIDNP